MLLACAAGVRPAWGEKMSDAPVWSVVIPTRDRRRELGECLHRLAPGFQTLDAAQYEVVVADDGDFDATDVLLRAEFPWTRHVRGPRRGPAANRNAGARAARGVDRVCRRRRRAVAGMAGRVCRTGCGTVVLEGRTTCDAGLPSARFHAPENNAGGVLWSCNFAIDRALFGALGGFDEGLPLRAHGRRRPSRAPARPGTTPRWVPEARVDHPPRRQPSGTRLGEYREAEVRYLYKHGASRPVRWRLMRNIALSRLVNIRARPGHRLAAGPLGAGCGVVARRAPCRILGACERPEFPAKRAT